MADHHKRNPFSLLAKIVGVFTVKSKRMSRVHIMLMENALQIENEDKLQFIFDLKGSTVNRSVKGKLKNTTTRKDVCFLKTKKAHPKLMKIDPDDKERILTIINKDVEFLRRNGLMDYSLLLSVEKA